MPNIISLFRVIVSPIFFLYVISDDPMLVQTACVLFLFGAVSDYFDGWLARKFKAVTSWGKFFDPLADKFLTSAAFIAFVIKGIVPLWMVVVIIVRDFGTTALRIIAEYKSKKLRTSQSAKTKTFLQMTFIAVILLLLFFKSIVPLKEWIPAINSLIYSKLTIAAMLILTIITVWTLIDYIMEYVKANAGIDGEA